MGQTEKPMKPVASLFCRGVHPFETRFGRAASGQFPPHIGQQPLNSTTVESPASSFGLGDSEGLGSSWIPARDRAFRIQPVRGTDGKNNSIAACAA
jgi:hypothetical protein